MRPWRPARVSASSLLTRSTTLKKRPLADRAHLVLDLALRPGRGRRASDRIDQVVAAHLLEATVVGPLLAHEDRVHRPFSRTPTMLLFCTYLFGMTLSAKAAWTI